MQFSRLLWEAKDACRCVVVARLHSGMPDDACSRTTCYDLYPQGPRNASAKTHSLIAKGLCARAFEKRSMQSVDYRELMLTVDNLGQVIRIVDEGELRALLREPEALASARLAFRALAEERIVQPAPIGMTIPGVDGEIHIKGA